MRRILFIVQKEFRQIKRTKAYFGVIFVAPFVMLLIFGSAITTEVKNIPTAVLDWDHSARSREIIRTIEASESFSFLGTVTSEERAKEFLDDGKASLVIVIPPGFTRGIENGGVPKLQLLVDGVNGNSAGVELGYVTALLSGIQFRWAAERSKTVILPAAAGERPDAPSSPAEGAAQTAGVSPAAPVRISVIPRMWYNPNLESKLNFVPGLIGVLLVMVTSFLTAVNIVREKEIGTLEQLMVTPLHSLQLMIGKIVPFAIMGFAQLSISVLAAGLVFGIWMKGSLLLFYGMAAIFALSTLGLGIFVSTVARTQQQAMFIAWFIMIFAMLLSGFFVPIENMPKVVQYITYVNPLRYFISVLREIYLKGTGFRYLWQEAVAMGAIGVTALGSAALRFHKRVK